MEIRKQKSKLTVDLESVIEALGYSLVDCSSKRISNSFQVTLIIYSPEGIGVDDCTKVYRTVLPRIEMLQDSKDINLEVSSPGINRKLKYYDELAVFKGKRAKFYLESENQWVSGLIGPVEDAALTLIVNEENITIPFDDIQKGKLE